MNFFEFTDKELFFRNDGELVIIAAWGDNSLRVQSSLMIKSRMEMLLLSIPM